MGQNKGWTMIKRSQTVLSRKEEEGVSDEKTKQKKKSNKGRKREGNEPVGHFARIGTWVS